MPAESDPPADIYTAPASSNNDGKWSPRVLIRHAERSHSKLPGIRKIPLRALAVILLVAVLNVLAWIAAAVVLVCLPLRHFEDTSS